MIYSFRFRDGVRGVTERHVEATSLTQATAQAEAWVNRKPGAQFIPNSVQCWLISGEDLPPAVEAPAETKGDIPGTKEQRERLTKQAAARMAGTGVGSAVKSGERVGA